MNPSICVEKNNHHAGQQQAGQQAYPDDVAQWLSEALQRRKLAATGYAQNHGETGVGQARLHEALALTAVHEGAKGQIGFAINNLREKKTISSKRYRGQCRQQP